MSVSWLRRRRLDACRWIRLLSIFFPSRLTCARHSRTGGRGRVPRRCCRAGDAESLPHWFTHFLNDRQTRKPSAHTMKAYRQEFIAIASLMTDSNPERLTVADITKDSMRQAFATYARDHEAASIRRCWSSWNVLCTFLYTGEQLTANPMQLVGRPKPAKPLPRTAVEALLETVADDQDSTRRTDWAERDLALILTGRTDWAERDLALILTGLLAGLRAEELQQADVGDIRTTGMGEVYRGLLSRASEAASPRRFEGLAGRRFGGPRISESVQPRSQPGRCALPLAHRRSARPRRLRRSTVDRDGLRRGHRRWAVYEIPVPERDAGIPRVSIATAVAAALD